MTATKELRRPRPRFAHAAGPDTAPLSFLEQAQVCREQARDAARLRRFKAALGLFATAAALCHHARGRHEADELTRSLADEQLQQIGVESATYVELLVSLEKPLLKT